MTTAEKLELMKELVRRNMKNISDYTNMAHAAQENEDDQVPTLVSAQPQM